MTKNKPKWEIPSRSRSCSKGQEPLEPEAPYYALLTTDEAGFYHRSDFCVTCWQKEVEMGALPANSVHWRALVPKRQSKKLDFAEFGERALSLLREVAQENDRQSQEEAFALGLYLQRFKMIAVRQEIQRGAIDYTLYEVLENGEILTVPRIKLATAEIARLQASLTEKLEAS